MNPIRLKIDPAKPTRDRKTRFNHEERKAAWSFFCFMSDTLRVCTFAELMKYHKNAGSLDKWERKMRKREFIFENDLPEEAARYFKTYLFIEKQYKTWKALQSQFEETDNGEPQENERTDEGVQN